MIIERVDSFKGGKKKRGNDHGGLEEREEQTRSFNSSWTLGKIIILYNRARKDYDHERSLRSSTSVFHEFRLEKLPRERERENDKEERKKKKRNLRANLILSFFRRWLLSIAPLDSYGSRYIRSHYRIPMYG